MRSAVTISLVEEARGGPFVFWDDLPSACVQAAQLGFDAVEIFAPSAESIDVAALRQLLARNHLAVAAFGTGAGWVKQKLRLTDSSADVRRRAVEFIGELIDLGAQFGAPAIIGSMQGRWGEGVERTQAFEWLRSGLNDLGERALRHGVPLLYEPLNRYEANLLCRVADAIDFLGSLQTQNVLLLSDLFHMNIEERDIAAALRLAGPKLGHVHWADSNRQAMGFGHTDVKPIAAALREVEFKGYVSAEVLPLPDSKTAARQTIESMREGGLF
jgi:sugar phosphate isomerase/epimerase